MPHTLFLLVGMTFMYAHKLATPKAKNNRAGEKRNPKKILQKTKMIIRTTITKTIKKILMSSSFFPITRIFIV